MTERAGQGGTITIPRLYEYNSAGRISKISMPDKDGQQGVAETYSYDADGRKKKIVLIDPDCLLEIAERCSEWTEQMQPMVRQERRA
jgi:hypothetical protein